MRTRWFQIGLGVLMFCLLVVEGQKVEAGGFTFTKVVDTSTTVPGETGTFTDLGLLPVIDGATVVFMGFSTNSPPFIPIKGHYTVTDGLVEIVADNFTPVPGGFGTFTNFPLALYQPPLSGVIT